MNAKAKGQTMADVFLEEYTSPDAVSKYTRATAGYGISYLLEHDYNEVYCRALDLLPATVRQRGIRVLECGCGGGMTLIHLASLLRRRGTPLGLAVGTDFSPVLIAAAQREATLYLGEEDHRRIQFHLAANHALVQDLTDAMGNESVSSSFHLVLAVNTIRYCHRGERALGCARDIMELLAPGGLCVVIDMNNRFPAFRSALKNRLRGINKKDECRIPSLEEYAAPFREVGFEILCQEHFCWIPHSSGRSLCTLMRILSPLLDIVARTRAMRSLVVARKPASHLPH